MELFSFQNFNVRSPGGIGMEGETKEFGGQLEDDLEILEM